MDTIMEFFRGQGFKRFTILAVLTFFIYVMRDFANVFLITFILTFLMYRLQRFIAKMLAKFIKIEQEVIVIALYVLFITMIVLVISKYLPIIIDQGIQITKQIMSFYQQSHDDPIINYVIESTKRLNIVDYIEQWDIAIFKYITDVSKWGLNIFISLILSLFFLLERNKIIRFTTKFKYSKISSFYNEIEYFCRKFIRSFGKVIEVQILISLINSILSIIALTLIGLPKVLGLGIMIFILGLIPVAGVFISLVPLSLTAYTVGGLTKVIYVLIIIAVLHALEGYILNPKLMSSKTKLPVFYTFIILIVSEHFFGIWGLIIGMPIFIFILDILEVNND
ncbi:AI-2E family transporter [Clostridium polyendosporum]|uniref:AI-2E family transporter n=1 Tax=Clostridium polyendosporum TaxID=69208 RepID=A0A919VEG9_9CLOT|nr:AI-2E family transporter [Clostridium polyendosporum]GIM27420.1 AI-2E family transporter [Clostridium polyendosporum]